MTILIMIYYPSRIPRRPCPFLLSPSQVLPDPHQVRLGEASPGIDVKGPVSHRETEKKSDGFPKKNEVFHVICSVKISPELAVPFEMTSLKKDDDFHIYGGMKELSK